MNTSLLYETFGVNPFEERTKKYNLAGYAKEDINVTAKNGFLTILAENEELGKTRYIASIPRNTDLKKIKASVKEGLLKVEMPEKDKEDFSIKVT